MLGREGTPGWRLAPKVESSATRHTAYSTLVGHFATGAGLSFVRLPSERILEMSGLALKYVRPGQVLRRGIFIEKLHCLIAPKTPFGSFGEPAAWVSQVDDTPRY